MGKKMFHIRQQTKMCCALIGQNGQPMKAFKSRATNSAKCNAISASTALQETKSSLPAEPGRLATSTSRHTLSVRRPAEDPNDRARRVHLGYHFVHTINIHIP
uniref:Uncharacterized protein n=1 Tax=Photinus pyralis TaxID=7054 RepID=A0A1Y1MKL2_PHOPY